MPGKSEAVSPLRQKYPEQIDLSRAQAKCLKAKGWPVELRDDATISINLRPGTEADYNRDGDLCLREAGVDPDAPPAEVVLKKAYKLSVKGAACLREAGWSISKTPTYATFKSTYDSDAWFPWAEVPEGDAAESEDVCPPPGPDY